MSTAIPPGSYTATVNRPDLPHNYTNPDTDPQEALAAVIVGYTVWDGDAWLRSLPEPDRNRQHEQLVAAAVEHFPGLDYSMHLVPAGQGLPRPQADQWVIYSHGRAAESYVHPTEQEARRTLYALVAYEAMEYSDEENDVLVHVRAEDPYRCIGVAGVTAYTGSLVVYGLLGDEPFAVNVNGEDHAQARQVLAERLGVQL